MKTITNRQLPVIRDLLMRLNGVPNVKLAYASAKTMMKITAELKDLELIQKPDQEFTDFATVLENVKKKWAVKRKNGEPSTKLERVGNQQVEVYDIPPDQLKSYQDEAEDLEVKFKAVIDTQKTKEQNFAAIQDEPSKVQFHLVDLKEVSPLLEKNADGQPRITGSQFTAMAFLLRNPKLKLDMIPADISQADMLTLVEYFDL